MTIIDKGAEIMNWDYIAGLFDGEGSIFFADANNVRTEISNTDPHILEKIRDFTGVGNLYSIHPKVGKRKAVYAWRVFRQKDIVMLCEQLIPRCYIKRNKLEEAHGFILSKSERKEPRRLLEKDLSAIKSMYYDEHQSLSLIARKFNVDHSTVWKFMKNHSLPRRSHQEAALLMHKR